MFRFLHILNFFGLYTTLGYSPTHNYNFFCQYKTQTINNFNNLIPQVFHFFFALRSLLLALLHKKHQISFLILTLRRKYFVEINLLTTNIENSMATQFLQIKPISFSKNNILFLHLDFLLVLGDILPEDSVYIAALKQKLLPIFGICSRMTDISLFTYYFAFSTTFPNVYIILLFVLRYIKYLVLQFRQTVYFGRQNKQRSRWVLLKKFKIFTKYTKHILHEKKRLEYQKLYNKAVLRKKNTKIFTKSGFSHYLLYRKFLILKKNIVSRAALTFKQKLFILLYLKQWQNNYVTRSLRGLRFNLKKKVPLTAKLKLTAHIFRFSNQVKTPPSILRDVARQKNRVLGNYVRFLKPMFKKTLRKRLFGLRQKKLKRILWIKKKSTSSGSAFFFKKLRNFKQRPGIAFVRQHSIQLPN